MALIAVYFFFLLKASTMAFTTCAFPTSASLQDPTASRALRRFGSSARADITPYHRQRQALPVDDLRQSPCGFVLKVPALELHSQNGSLAGTGLCGGGVPFGLFRQCLLRITTITLPTYLR